MSPVIDIPELKVKPPEAITKPCDPLLLYTSSDYRDVIKTTVKNNNLYFLCASKMKSAAIFFNSL
tara:strand:+ start:6741 stop:6935 length:195 start_codon:yes stop_codon:yes gene_type:complete